MCPDCAGADDLYQAAFGYQCGVVFEITPQQVGPQKERWSRAVGLRRSGYIAHAGEPDATGNFGHTTGDSAMDCRCSASTGKMFTPGA
jgi:hypothetical protein